MYQSLTLIGRIDATPERRISRSGRHATVFYLLIEQSIREADGSFTNESVRFRVSCFEPLGEFVYPLLRQDAMVLVRGTLAQPHAYRGRNGRWQAGLDVRAQQVLALPLSTDKLAPNPMDEHIQVLEPEILLF